MARSTKPVADRSFAGRPSHARDPARKVAGPKTAPRSDLPAAAAGEVRIGPVAAIPDVLRKLGVAPSLPFVRSGVPLAAFRNPENRIAFEALGRLFSECSTLTGCGHFGLLVGECFELNGLGAIGYLMRNSPTVGEALRALLLHLYLHDRGAVPILINLEASHVLLGYSIYRHGTPGASHLYDVAIAIGYRALKEICGARWKPLRVQFSHARPKDSRPYRRLFGPNVQFDAEVSGIVFQVSWLDHAIAGADPNLHELVTQAIRQQQANSTMSFADVVRGALHQMVLSGTSSAGNVALLFGMHERTLRKRLTAERTSLHRLVSQTRFELAKQLLENTELPLSEIASALRYADAAVSSRAFRSWSKTSPREWRARCDRKAVPHSDALGAGAKQRPVRREHVNGRTWPGPGSRRSRRKRTLIGRASRRKSASWRGLVLTLAARSGHSRATGMKQPVGTETCATTFRQDRMSRPRLAEQAALLNPADPIWRNSVSISAWCKSASRIGWEQRARCQCGVLQAPRWRPGFSDSSTAASTIA